MFEVRSILQETVGPLVRYSVMRKGLSLQSPVVTSSTTPSKLTNSTLCTHSVFMCFVWISEQTAIISLYNINWLVCITETACLLAGTDCMFKYDSGYFWPKKKFGALVELTFS
jgi:hypothetical protein